MIFKAASFWNVHFGCGVLPLEKLRMDYGENSENGAVRHAMDSQNRKALRYAVSAQSLCPPHRRCRAGDLNGLILVSIAAFLNCDPIFNTALICRRPVCIRITLAYEHLIPQYYQIELRQP